MLRFASMTAARILGNDPYLEAVRDAAPSGRRAELVSGSLLMSPAPLNVHQLAQGALHALLRAAVGVRRRGGGGPPPSWWFLLGPELHLGPLPDKTNPDIAGWRVERAPDVHLYPITAAPDWICEVLSPSTETFDRGTKLPAFAGHGVAHAWLVDPDARRLEVYRRSSAAMREVARFEGDTVVRAEPFDSVELDLAELWG
jgi:Uma2 family endonuclease